MAKNIIERFLKNRFTFLLFSIILLLLLFPLVAAFAVFNLSLLEFIFLFMLIAVLRSLNLSKTLFCGGAVVAVVIFFMNVLNAAVISGGSLKMGIAISVGYSLFVLFSVNVLILRIFQEEYITMDTILGGIAIYFLIGILWAFIYETVILVSPGALAAGEASFQDLLYFSFVTLTTLGYGDIVPVSPFVKNLAILEAIIGQLFLAIFIARLIGLHMGQERISQNRDSGGLKK